MLEAPDEYLAELNSVLLRLTVPEDWSASKEAVICSRTSIGWSGCVSLKFEWGESDAEDIPSGWIPLEVFYGEDTQIELVMLGSDAVKTGTQRDIAVFDAESLKYVDGRQADISITADTDAASALRGSGEVAVEPGD